ncbi:MAG: hypothetical protein MJZ26_08955 [Fibrobacter sp.]|nr:hypothetical protein [Fibrobacter sp.]
MRIGLIDADKMWRKKDHANRYGGEKPFPNLAIMKLSAYHKQRGDEVEWYCGMNERYDLVYVSKVFSSTPDSREHIQADEVIYGGTGFCIIKENGKEVYREPRDPNFMGILKPEIEHIYPDYGLYGIEDTAYGFLSRGCPRGCSFCHVAPKEGQRSRKVADLSEWWNGQKNIILCDPNIVACREWADLLGQLADSKAWVDINQGLDARLLTEEKVQALNRIKMKNVHFAWDRYQEKERVIKGLQIFKDNWRKKVGRSVLVFTIVNYDTTIEQDLDRVYILRDMGYEPYIMVYDKDNCSPLYKKLQRWVNMKAVFHKIEKFEDYCKDFKEQQP